MRPAPHALFVPLLRLSRSPSLSEQQQFFGSAFARPRLIRGETTRSTSHAKWAAWFREHKRRAFGLLLVCASALVPSVGWAQSQPVSSPRSIKIIPDTGSIAPGTTLPFVAVGYDSDDSNPTPIAAHVIWSSSDPNVATISGDGAGVAKGVIGGDVTISAQYGELKAMASLTVTAPTAKPTKIKGAAWLIFDTQKPSDLRICLKPVTKDVPADCPRWDSANFFFESGAVISLQVLNSKFRSTFNVAVNGVAIADNLPAVRGLSPAPTPSGTPSILSSAVIQKSFEEEFIVPGGEATKQLESEAQKKAFANLFALYNTARSAADVLEPFEGSVESYDDSTGQPKNAICSSRPESPKPGALGLLEYAQTLRNDAFKCYDDNKSKPFTDEQTFNNLTDRTNQLRDSVVSLESALPTSTELTTLAADIKTAWDAYSKAAKTFSGTFSSTDAEMPFVPGGDLYEALNTQVGPPTPTIDKRIAKELDLIDGQTLQAFSLINSLYQRSERLSPIEVPIKQYTTNLKAAFQVLEVPGFVPYKFPLNVPNQQDGSQIKPPPPGKQDPPPGPGGTNTTPQSPGSSGTAIYSGNFSVHKFYRANIVAGFFASTLRVREYGVTNNGQATTGTAAVVVPVVGGVHRPQLHYFVGLNYYLWPRDLFPGALKKRDYATPGLFFGYGLDALNNYLIGANWELPWGINLSSGLHIGQETFLAPGIQTGVTVLQAGTTTPPTVNRIRPGAYASIGFDLAVMKSALGQLFGGSSNKSGN